MSINIKNREADRLLAELRRITGKGASELLLDRLRREAARQRRGREYDIRREQLVALGKRYRARLGKRLRHPDQIIGYDALGLPK